MKTRIGALLVAALVVTGCAAAGGPPDTSDTPRRDLAERPTTLAPDGASPRPHRSSHPRSRSTETADGSRPSDDRSTTTAPSVAPPGTSEVAPNQPATASPFYPFARMADGANDAGLQAPTYADLRSVTMSDNGSSLRVVVTLTGELPKRTSAGEVIGIGVDLYPPGSGRESDYQLFADGEPDGWFAYLDTPKGFVRYPGTFALGGSRLVFTVPWSSVGDPTAGRVSAFVDWTRKKSGLTGNNASNDYAPTLGTQPYQR